MGMNLNPLCLLTDTDLPQRDTHSVGSHSCETPRIKASTGQGESQWLGMCQCFIATGLQHEKMRELKGR